MLAIVGSGPGGTQNSTQVSCMYKGPGTQAIFHYFSLHITRELDWKQRYWNSSQHSHGLFASQAEGLTANAGSSDYLLVNALVRISS